MDDGNFGGTGTTRLEGRARDKLKCCAGPPSYPAPPSPRLALCGQETSQQHTPPGIPHQESCPTRVFPGKTEPICTTAAPNSGQTAAKSTEPGRVLGMEAAKDHLALSDGSGHEAGALPEVSESMSDMQSAIRNASLSNLSLGTAMLDNFPECQANEPRGADAQPEVSRADMARTQREIDKLRRDVEMLHSYVRQSVAVAACDTFEPASACPSSFVASEDVPCGVRLNEPAHNHQVIEGPAATVRSSSPGDVLCAQGACAQMCNDAPGACNDDQCLYSSSHNKSPAVLPPNLALNASDATSKADATSGAVVACPDAAAAESAVEVVQCTNTALDKISNLSRPSMRAPPDKAIAPSHSCKPPLSPRIVPRQPQQDLTPHSETQRGAGTLREPQTQAPASAVATPRERLLCVSLASPSSSPQVCALRRVVCAWCCGARLEVATSLARVCA